MTSKYRIDPKLDKRLSDTAERLDITKAAAISMAIEEWANARDDDVIAEGSYFAALVNSHNRRIDAGAKRYQSAGKLLACLYRSVADRAAAVEDLYVLLKGVTRG